MLTNGDIIAQDESSWVGIPGTWPAARLWAAVCVPGRNLQHYLHRLLLSKKDCDDPKPENRWMIKEILLLISRRIKNNGSGGTNSNVEDNLFPSFFVRLYRMRKLQLVLESSVSDPIVVRFEYGINFIILLISLIFKFYYFFNRYTILVVIFSTCIKTKLKM